jgi:hypothetical protein
MIIHGPPATLLPHPNRSLSAQRPLGVTGAPIADERGRSLSGDGAKHMAERSRCNLVTLLLRLTVCIRDRRRRSDPYRTLTLKETANACQR